MPKRDPSKPRKERKPDSPVVAARRKKLREWIDDKFAGVALRFATAAGMPQSQVQDMLDGRKSFGEKVAAAVEAKSVPRMPENYLVRPDEPQGDSSRMTVWKVLKITQEEAALGIEWGKLEEPLRTEIWTKIHTEVSATMREKHSGKKSKRRVRRDDERPRTN